ncbi:MAG TPA: type II toxin-antitoxin system antitoxin SocA domain-containing protein [Mycobacteriales bacterium]|nr:type II toxin-antitoxin system antitoxin SocA domain-containing protein [Mycobacteriales bacterium]
MSAQDVAAVLRVPELGAKRLHTPLYYGRGHHLATFGEPLSRESVSAWDMGPVVGAVWRQEDAGKVPAVRAGLGQAAWNTVGCVLSRYGGLTGGDLARGAHGEPPWQRANRDRPPRGTVRIEPEWTREYFATLGAPEVGIGLDAAAVSAWPADAETRRARPARPTSPEDRPPRSCRAMRQLCRPGPAAVVVRTRLSSG